MQQDGCTGPFWPIHGAQSCLSITSDIHLCQGPVSEFISGLILLPLVALEGAEVA